MVNNERHGALGLRTARHAAMRADLRLIADVIDRGSRVLDVGCGDGVLLDYLVHERGVDGRGIELKQSGVNACVARGLSVIQGDANIDLAEYPSRAFDYVVLSQTLQATRDPKGVLGQLVRIGRRAVVSITNFGYWRVRLDLLLRGRMPVTDTVASGWYNSADIHPCTIRDFADLCAGMDIQIHSAIALSRRGQARPFDASSAVQNLLGEAALFLLSRR